MTDDSSVPAPFSRRSFLANAGRGLVAAAVAGELLPTAAAQATDETGSLGKPIKLPAFHAKTEQQTGPVPEPMPPGKRVGFAVVGLGDLALNQIIPAFGRCKKAKLVAVVSGSPDKGKQVAREHGLADKAVYDYKHYDDLRHNEEVDVVYIVLPNGLHAEYTVRGAQAGKHILCEKPMANSTAECQEMIGACQKAGRKLMIAYRIQYEPHNRLAQKFLREKKYGATKLIDAVNGQNQGDPGQWRHDKKLAGGGALPDVGLYCLNTMRFLVGEEPTEVSAMTYSTPDDPRFKEVEESVTWQMRFPGGVLANCATSYGIHENRRYRVSAETGWFGLDPAFSVRKLADGDFPGRRHAGVPRPRRPHAEGSVRLGDGPHGRVRLGGQASVHARRGRSAGSTHHGSDLRVGGERQAGQDRYSRRGGREARSLPRRRAGSRDVSAARMNDQRTPQRPGALVRLQVSVPNREGSAYKWAKML